jgi:hypothetical protein
VTRNEIKEQRGELDLLERTLEPTLSSLFSMAFGQIKSEGVVRKLKPVIDHSHDEFDDWVRKAVVTLISDYQASGSDISSQLMNIIQSAKLDAGIAESFQDARNEMDSLALAISEIVDLSYKVERSEFQQQIQLAQTKQRRLFDVRVRLGLKNIIEDYGKKSQQIVMGLEPTINAAKILGVAAVDEVVQAKNDVNALDALFDKVMTTILSASYGVNRLEFMEHISRVQAVRKRDFADQVRRATRTLLDFAGRGRHELADDRTRIAAQAEKFMLAGKYNRASESFEIAARISSELGEPERAREYREKAQSMERLVV